jgi:hypothetical protein
MTGRPDEPAITPMTSEGASRGSVVEQIIVPLIDKASDDLRVLQQHTGLSKTDITNRAISIYAFLEGQIRAGHDVLVRNSETGELQMLRLI